MKPPKGPRVKVLRVSYPAALMLDRAGVTQALGYIITEDAPDMVIVGLDTPGLYYMQSGGAVRIGNVRVPRRDVEILG